MSDPKSLHRRRAPAVSIGQVWEDTGVAGDQWLVKVMKLNRKSARVEPCEDNGWYTTAGYQFQYRMEFSHFENGRMKLVKDTTTDEKIAPLIYATYGNNGMSRALVQHLAGKIDEWPNGGPPRYGAETREDMVRLTCWDWFSGGDTAAGIAHRIEERLDA